MATRKSKKAAPLKPQQDPKAPVDSKALLQHLVPTLKALEKDLLQRADGSEGVTAALEARWEVETNNERTADSFPVWRRGVVTQVAAAWVLSCVFVRILEDRGLLSQNRLAGPGAESSQQEFMKLAPFLTERDYLLLVFRELCHFEATRELFDQDHNLVWRLAPSAEGAKALLAVFRQGSPEAPAFRFGQADTRFLGDLYQDLSEDVRKKYALLQTPDFVEEFILARTLDPALEAFGLDGTTVLDPTCGSGHFLLGAFERLFDRRLAEQPNLNPVEVVEKALGAVHGLDINPYAISITRFRLLLAGLEKCEVATLAGARRMPLQAAVADSLLHRNTDERPLDDRDPAGNDEFNGAFELEDGTTAAAMLATRHAAVVGNPPYITVKDKVLRDRYRSMYRSAAGKYSLAAPFAERFFELCRPGGFTGMITANSFMKREFGKALIEQVLPQLDLQLVVNTSGAYIPGHGTPTVLLFGQNRPPVEAEVQAVLAKRGEPSTPERAAEGKVWSSIADHIDDGDFENDFISVVRVGRDTFGKHPWSLGGGGAAELKELLESRSASRLGDVVSEMGFASFTGLDDAFILPSAAATTGGVELERIRPMVIGECVRDWAATPLEVAITPYDTTTQSPIAWAPEARWARNLWPFRACSEAVKGFGGKTRKECGENWWEWYRWQAERYQSPLRITFAFVATHNHFVLDRGGKVFNRSAPIIKLPESATEDDHYALLAYLNSSTACFWMKQVFYPKGGDQMGDGGRLSSTSWEDRYEFAGTGLKSLPLPQNMSALIPLGKRLEELAQSRLAILADALEGQVAPAEAARADSATLDEMVRTQEALDWLVYHLFGLTDIGQGADSKDCIGQRAFELSAFSNLPANDPNMAWFRRAGLSAPLTSAAGGLKGKRIQATRDCPELSVIEQLDYKRWWRASDVLAQVANRALVRRQSALEPAFQDLTIPLSLSALESELHRNQTYQHFDNLLRSISTCPQTLEEETHLEAIPYLSALQYKTTGLEKHATWQHTWDLQRREDAGEAVGNIPVPPKYSQKDFRNANYWRLRGKLDVPKERFISYPGCESDEDKNPVYGWAGWNHLQRAIALSGLYHQRREEGWEGERLLPMLVGLLELLPWLKQWHNEPDEELGGERPAAQFEAFVHGELQALKKTPEQAREAVLAWVEAGGGRTKAKPKKKAARTKQQPDSQVTAKKGLAKAKEPKRAKGAA